MIFKPILRTRNSWFFFYSGFEVLTKPTVNPTKNNQQPRKTTNTTKTTVKSKKSQKNHNFQTIPQDKVLVVFRLQRFWWSGARNHCKNKEKLPLSILRDSLKLVVVEVFPGFTCGFGGLPWFRAPDHQQRCTNYKFPKHSFCWFRYEPSYSIPLH